MRGATCWSDHFLVRAKLCLGFILRRSPVGGARRLPFAVHLLHDKDTLTTFQRELHEASLRSTGVGDADVTWHLLKQDLLRVSSEVLGCGQEFQPDWFLESKSELEPLLAAKRDTHARMLACDTPVTRAAFRFCPMHCWSSCTSS